jgi:hypothetical protein
MSTASEYIVPELMPKTRDCLHLDTRGPAPRSTEHTVVGSEQLIFTAGYFIVFAVILLRYGRSGRIRKKCKMPVFLEQLMLILLL